MKKIKKLLCAALITCCALSASMSTVLAGNIKFDINTTGDTLSYKEQKSDYEQKFYAKALSFSKKGTLNCVSTKYKQTSVTSRNIALTSTGVLKSATYKSYAEAKKLYFMSGTSSIKNMRVTGKYCP